MNPHKETHMRKIKASGKIILILLASALLFAGCGKTKTASSKKTHALNPRQGVYYSLFVRSFADSDGNGTGDFNGIRSKLDYLEDLGISGIWLLPIYPSGSYHGYDVDDYYAVNPDYGTMQDFEALVSECKSRGIAVMLDITFNHSSSNNPWFKASKNPDDPHRKWYHWISENPANEYTDDSSKYNVNQKIWGHNLWNKSGNGWYAGEFYDGMPDFNLDCPELRRELKNVLRFWTEKGVSGFRFDAAGHIYDKIKMPSDFTDSTSSSQAFWKEISDYLDEINPENYCVGEVWENTSIRAAALGGLNSVFHFDMGDTYILGNIREKSAGANNFAHVLENDYEAYSRYNKNFIDAPFLSNHDQARIAGNLKGNVEELKVAAGMYILTQGIPFVYYGEEIGMMSGTKDETKRTPLLWGEKDKAQTSWASDADCIYNTNTKSIRTQEKDKSSLLNYYKELINFRNGCPAFNGKLSAFDTGNSSLSSWKMKNGNDEVLVVHNVSAENTVLELPGNASYTPLFQTKKSAKNGGSSITIPPLCTMVFSIENNPD